MMKQFTSILSYALLLQCLLLTSCTGAGSLDSQVVFVGSTPGDDLIKSLLTIRSDSKIDFIRWELILNNNDSNQSTFSLAVVFGESQPNTLGFKGGGEKLSFEGEYTISQDKNGKLIGEMIHLKSKNLPAGIRVIRLNQNLLHLLTPQNRLMIGNGGWSYTLNRINPVSDSSSGFVSKVPASLLTTVTSDTIGVFDGRTICSTEHLELNGISAASCQRIKWRLILYQDPKKNTPTTFQLIVVYVGISDTVYTRTGNWEMIQGRETGSSTFVYLLRPNGRGSQEFLAFLRADDNILFFLDRDWNLMVGNGDHSYTLNRSPE
jgi:hypothetical protein